jgi:hypothetical protein
MPDASIHVSRPSIDGLGHRRLSEVNDRHYGTVYVVNDADSFRVVGEGGDFF